MGSSYNNQRAPPLINAALLAGNLRGRRFLLSPPAIATGGDSLSAWPAGYQAVPAGQQSTGGLPFSAWSADHQAVLAAALAAAYGVKFGGGVKHLQAFRILLILLPLDSQFWVLHRK